MKPKVGDEITAVYSRPDRRCVILMRVTKVGTKYIYGMTQFVEPDGQTRDGLEMKVTIEVSNFYAGLRHDLREEERQHQADIIDWKHQRSEKEKELEWDLRDRLRAQMDAWKLENPRPERSELPREVD